MNAREEIAFLLWQVVPSTDDADARATAGQMLDAHAAEVRAATLAAARGVDTHQATRRRAMSDFLVLLRHSFGADAVAKFLDDHPDLAELADRTETGDGS